MGEGSHLGHVVRLYLLLGLEPPARDLAQQWAVETETVHRLVLTGREHVPGPKAQDESTFFDVRLGPFRLTRFLGKGAVSRVYRASRDGTELAVKVILPQGPSSVLGQFLAVERPALKRLRGRPGLIGLEDAGEWHGFEYIAMEFMPGGSLRDQIRAARRAKRGGGEGHRLLDLGRLTEWVQNAAVLARGLDTAHREGIIHRDIKPANILVGEHGEMRLADFGVSSIAQTSHGVEETLLTCTKDVVVGTPPYWAPEIVDSSLGPQGPASDIYSLGLSLYEGLTLKSARVVRTFEDPLAQLVELRHCILYRYPTRPRRLDARFDPELENILYKALERDPRRRYTSAGALADDLERFAHGDRPAIRRGRTVWVRRTLEQHPTRMRTAKRLALLACATLLIFGLIPAVADRIGSHVRDTRQREALHSAGDDVMALERFAVEHPDSKHLPESYRRLGISHAAQGNVEQAIISWAEAMARAPKGLTGQDARLRLAALLFDYGHSDEAAHLLTHNPGAPPAHLMQRHHLVAARVALTRDQPGEATWHAERAEEGADEAVASSAHELSAVTKEFFPPQVQRLDPTQGHVAILVGTMRKGERNVLLVASPKCFLFRWANGSLRLVDGDLRVGENIGGCASADLDGDGVEEIIVTWNPGDHSEKTGTQLRVLKLTDEGFEAEFKHEIERADYCVAAGDVNRDGLKDLVLGKSWPKRGMAVWRGVGGLQFEEMDAGAMDVFRKKDSDVSWVAIHDADGDGEADVIASSMYEETFALHVFSYEEAGFRECFARRFGFVRGGGLWRRPPGHRPTIVFGLDAQFHEDPTPPYGEFHPQGLYEACCDRASGTFTVRPIFTTEQLSGDVGASPPPWRLAFSPYGLGLSKSLGPCALYQTKTFRGKRARASTLNIVGLGSNGGRGVTLGPAADAGSWFGDLDGDGDAEVLRLSSGELRLYGVGGGLASTAPIPPTPEARGGPVEAEWPELTIARMLERLHVQDGARRFYERAWKTLREKRAGHAAILGLIQTCWALRDWTACKAAIDEYERAYPLERGDAALLRARYALRLGQTADAYDRAMQAARDGHLDEDADNALAALRAELTRWLNPRTVDMPDDRWLDSESSLPRTSAEGPLHFVDKTGSLARAYTSLAWDGGSFQLSYEVRIDELDSGHGLIAGMTGPSFASRKVRGLYAAFTQTSSKPSAAALVDADGADRRASDETLRLLPRGQWLRAVMTYAAGLGTLSLAIYDQAGSVIDVMHVRGVQSLPGPWVLVLGLNGEGGALRARASFRRVRLVVPRETVFEIGDE